MNPVAMAAISSAIDLRQQAWEQVDPATPNQLPHFDYHAYLGRIILICRPYTAQNASPVLPTLW